MGGPGGVGFLGAYVWQSIWDACLAWRRKCRLLIAHNVAVTFLRRKEARSAQFELSIRLWPRINWPVNCPVICYSACGEDVRSFDVVAMFWFARLFRLFRLLWVTKAYCAQINMISETGGNNHDFVLPEVGSMVSELGYLKGFIVQLKNNIPWRYRHMYRTLLIHLYRMDYKIIY